MTRIYTPLGITVAEHIRCECKNNVDALKAALAAKTKKDLDKVKSLEEYMWTRWKTILIGLGQDYPDAPELDYEDYKSYFIDPDNGKLYRLKDVNIREPLPEDLECSKP